MIAHVAVPYLELGQTQTVNERERDREREIERQRETENRVREGASCLVLRFRPFGGVAALRERLLCAIQQKETRPMF
jgi:hypothetical protein